MGQAQEVASKRRRRVLVIDDEEIVGRYMSLLIGSWGYPITTTRKLETADFSNLNSSDIIFVDMMMPGQDGIQVLKALAGRAVESSIVLMSGTHAEILTTAEKLARQLGLRVSGILKKP